MRQNMKSGHDGSLRGSEEEEKTSGKNWGGGGGLTKTAKLKRMWKGTEDGNNTKVGKSNKAKR